MVQPVIAPSDADFEAVATYNDFLEKEQALTETAVIKATALHKVDDEPE